MWGIALIYADFARFYSLDIASKTSSKNLSQSEKKGVWHGRSRPGHLCDRDVFSENRSSGGVTDYSGNPGGPMANAAGKKYEPHAGTLV